MKRVTRKKSGQQPVTQREFTASMGAIKREFDQLRETMAVDKKEIYQTMATDKKEIFETMAADKQDIFNTMKADKKEIIREFKVVAENIHKYVAGANRDEISLMKDTQRQHGKRLVRIEKHLSLPHQL